MKFSAKNIFLIDGIGALITAILLSQLLTRFESFFGMPTQTLWILAIISVLISTYSMTCQFLLKSPFNALFKVIITANIAYCLLTSILIFSNLKSITLFGIAYFLGEIVIILFLAKKEYDIMIELQS